MFFRLPQIKCFLGACHTENGFYVLATRKMVFRDLSVTRNMGFGGCHKENGFKGLPNAKCVLRVRHKESGFQEVVTKKIVFRGLPH